MSHDTYEGQRTYKTDDFEQQLRTTLHTKATSYYPDGTKPPTWPTSGTRGAARNHHKDIHASSLRRRTTNRTLRKHKQLVVAAALTALAVAGGFSVSHFVNRDQLLIAHTPAETGTAAGMPAESTGSEQQSGPDSDSPVDKQSDPHDLPVHMKRTHDGPVRVANFPLVCPESKPKPGGGSEFLVSTKPVNPVAYCSSRGLMGKVDPKFAYAIHVDGAIQVSGRRLTGSPRVDTDVAPTEPVSALPAGFTYDGVDLEAAYLVMSHEVADSSCRTFSEYKQNLAKQIRTITGGSWSVTTGELRPHSEGHSYNRCHATYLDVHRRSVVVAKSALQTSTSSTTDTGHSQTQKIMTAVNSQCLSLSAAAKHAKEVAKDYPSASLGNPLIRVAVPNGRKCARAYQHPGEKTRIVLFGK